MTDPIPSRRTRAPRPTKSRADLAQEYAETPPSRLVHDRAMLRA